MAESSTDGAKTNDLIKLLERHPVAWFFLGIFLVLLADGNVRVTVGSTGINLLPPSTLPVQTLFRFLGFSLAIPVAYFFIAQKWGYSFFLKFALIVTWLLAVALLTMDFVRSQKAHMSAASWNYDLTTRTFSITMVAEGLRRHAGEALVLVVRKRDGLKDRESDHDIAIEKRSIRDSAEQEAVSINCSRIAGEWKLGDIIECLPFFAPNSIDISQIKTLGQLTSAGAKSCFSDPAWCTVSLVSTDSAKHLSKSDKLRLNKVLNDQATINAAEGDD